MKWLGMLILAAHVLACSSYDQSLHNYTEQDEIMRNQPGTDTISGRKKAWQQSGKLTPTPTPPQNPAFVSMQADFSDDPGIYTVQFAVDVIPNLADTDGYVRTEAELIWSVEGATVRRVISVTNGTSISGAGQAVRVRVYDTGSNPDVGGGFTEYTVTITVVKGSRPANPNPVTLQRKFSEVVVAPAATGSIDIPENCGVISALLGINPALGGVFPNPVQIEFSSPVGDTFTVYTFNNGQVPPWLPVPPGSTIVNITNIGLTQVTVYPTWGIDG